MEFSQEIVGLVITAIGLIMIVAAGFLPRQVYRWHLHAMEQLEPGVIIWPVRGIGLALALLGGVTLLGTM